MASKHFMVAVILMQALSCSCANKRSFTTRPSPTKSGICASNPCVHGQCQPYPSMNTYICNCIHGATGRNCEKETDMCLFNPCVFGTCSGHGINFTCTCDKGYTGKLCDKEIDMCLFNPCVFGTCSGHGLHYTCTCDKGWTGKLCNSQVNPINGGWTSWTTWSTCTLTCGTGTSSRSRSCTNPAPQNNGAQCPGSATDTQSCNSNVCPINGGWTSWTGWSSCTRTCGTGSSTKTRSCSNPVPQNNGTKCVGQATYTQSCNIYVCPVDGGWTQWTTWGHCSSTCGSGVTHRSKYCTNPTPRNHGATCSGHSIEWEKCNTNVCHAKCDVNIIERHIRQGTVAAHPDADVCQGKHTCSEALLLEACTLPSNDKHRWKPDLKFQYGCYYVTIVTNWEIPHVTTDRCLLTTRDLYNAVMDHCASLQRGEPVAEFIHGNYLEGMLNAVFWTCKGNYWEVAIQHLGYGVYITNGTAPPFTAKWIYTLR